jgi:hypothetical protein
MQWFLQYTRGIEGSTYYPTNRYVYTGGRARNSGKNARGLFRDNGTARGVIHLFPCCLHGANVRTGPSTRGRETLPRVLRASIRPNNIGRWSLRGGGGNPRLAALAHLGFFLFCHKSHLIVFSTSFRKKEKSACRVCVCECAHLPGRPELGFCVPGSLHLVGYLYRSLCCAWY